MGLSSSSSKTKTDQKTTETGSTTPFNLPGVDEALIDQTGRISAFGNMDPFSLIAPTSPLQNMAFQNVGSLADWQPQARTASQLAWQAGNRPAASAGPAATYNPAQGQASSYAAPQLGNPALVAARGYTPPESERPRELRDSLIRPSPRIGCRSTRP
jgi:hypothetical protein